MSKLCESHFSHLLDPKSNMVSYTTNTFKPTGTPTETFFKVFGSQNPERGSSNYHLLLEPFDFQSVEVRSVN